MNEKEFCKIHFLKNFIIKLNEIKEKIIFYIKSCKSLTVNFFLDIAAVNGLCFSAFKFSLLLLKKFDVILLVKNSSFFKIFLFFSFSSPAN